MDAYAVWEGELEVRQFRGARSIVGVFPYSKLGVINDRTAIRKERLGPRAFQFAIDTEPERRIDFLVGHDFGKPIASRQSGTLVIEDADDAVRFTATLPDDPPSWVVDVERSIAANLTTGLSPGFRVPPRTVVPDAERLTARTWESGRPMIRQIDHAVLREFSVVTSAVYEDGLVELRSESANAVLIVPRSIYAMAITITLAELQAALRLSDSPEETAEATTTFSLLLREAVIAARPNGCS